METKYPHSIVNKTGEKLTSAGIKRNDGVEYLASINEVACCRTAHASAL